MYEVERAWFEVVKSESVKSERETLARTRSGIIRPRRKEATEFRENLERMEVERVPQKSVSEGELLPSSPRVHPPARVPSDSSCEAHAQPVIDTTGKDRSC